MKTGWVTLPDNIVKNEAFENRRYLHMFVEMIIMANTEDCYFEKFKMRFPILRGQFITSTRTLAKKFRCDPKTMTKLLHILEKNNFIKKVCMKRKFTVITIVNYDLYRQKVVSETTTKSLVKSNVKAVPTTAPSKVESNQEDDTNREENFRNKCSCIFENIRKNDFFWEQLSKNFNKEIPELKALGENFFSYFLISKDKIYNQKKTQEHMYNWMNSQIKRINAYNNNLNSNDGKSKIDLRRGVDAPPFSEASLQKRAFCTKPAQR